MVKIFTDGSTFNNGKKNASGGIGLFIPYLEYELSMPFLLEVPTNQKTELYAIQKGLEVYLTYCMRKSNLSDEEKEVLLYTDSEYSIKSLTQWISGWKKSGWVSSKKEPVKNLEFIKPIDYILGLYGKKGINVKFVHINSHQKEPRKDSAEYEIWKGNDKVDRLAVKGSKEFQGFYMKETTVIESYGEKKVGGLKQTKIGSFFRN